MRNRFVRLLLLAALLLLWATPTWSQPADAPFDVNSPCCSGRVLK